MKYMFFTSPTIKAKQAQARWYSSKVERPADVLVIPAEISEAADVHSINIGKPQENHRKMVVLWDLLWDLMGYTPW